MFLVAGCGSGGGVSGAEQVTTGPTKEQQKAMAPDQVAAANDKNIKTYSAPPVNAAQGSSYRIAPANPNDPKFKPDPKLAGGH